MHVVVAEVHEVEQLAVRVAVLHGTALEAYGGHLLPCPERFFHHMSGEHVLQLRAHEGAAFSRLDMLKIGDRPQDTIDVQNHAIAKVGSRGHAASF